MRKLLSLVVAGVLATSIGVALATTNASPAMARCTFHLKWSNGMTGTINLHPFGKAEFAGVTCNNVLQTVIRIKNGPLGSCYRAPASPTTNRRWHWVESDGPVATIYCDQWYRIRCNASGCAWSSYKKLSNTQSPIRTVAFQRREPTTCTHFIAYDDGGQALSLPAGASVFSGEYLLQVPVSQAWKFCYPLSAKGSHLLRLKYDQSYCVSGYKHVGRIYKCSTTSENQQWTWRLHRSPFYHRFLNTNGVMCVANGNGSADIVDPTCTGKATHWGTG